MSSAVEDVDVLVVGAGPAGLIAAITLAREGIDTLVVERRLTISDMPRANMASTGTMELLRSWGLEQEIRAGEVPVEFQAWVSPSLAEAHDGHSIELGYPTRAQAALVSPTTPALVSQDHLEPVLERHLRGLAAARLERGVELTEVESGDDGVTVVLRDLAGGQARTVNARYLIAADGIRGTVRPALGIGAAVREHGGQTLGFQFRAPLWERMGDRRYTLYYPPSEDMKVFIPAGAPDRWVYATTWDAERHRIEDFPPERATEIIREVSGFPDLDVRIDRVQVVTYAVDLAERFREGSAFLVGDTAHRVTPRGATGMNSAIRDGHDLGWKIAWVLRGWADERLLDSYERERRPVIEHNVERSLHPSGSERGVAEELRADLGARLAHAWLPGRVGELSTLDLLGPGLTFFAGPDGPEPPEPGRVPTEVRYVDALTARALGIPDGGALMARADGVPVALWTAEAPCDGGSGSTTEARAAVAA